MGIGSEGGGGGYDDTEWPKRKANYLADAVDTHVEASVFAARAVVYARR